MFQYINTVLLCHEKHTVHLGPRTSPRCRCLRSPLIHHFWSDKSGISMAMFNSYVTNYRRVSGIQLIEIKQKPTKTKHHWRKDLYFSQSYVSLLMVYFRMLYIIVALGIWINPGTPGTLPPRILCPAGFESEFHGIPW